MPYQIIHGDEAFFRAKELARLKAAYTTAGLGDLNISILDGRKVTMPILREACETMPFMAEGRLVIIHDLLSRFQGAGRSDDENTPAEKPSDSSLASEVAEYCAHVPPFTRLVFAEERQINARNPVMRRAAADKEALITLCAPLSPDDLFGWVNAQVSEKAAAAQTQLSIEGDAVRLLVNQIGNNLQQLDLELDKLAGYADYGRISAEHVRACASENLDARIFAMVDALGRRERRNALHEHSMLLASGAHPLYILTMIARQYRLLIGAKTLAQESRADARLVSQELGVRDFATERLLQQARLYTLPELVAIYRSLAVLDQRIKTGQVEGELGLELFIIETTRTPQKRSLRSARASSSSSSSPEARSR
ncbi:MAG: DNA polymerase III subunit delta [Chloroflexi bacterium]|nr:DNA polymerase III subunit delta [Chloroflexota bacterium]